MSCSGVCFSILNKWALGFRALNLHPQVISMLWQMRGTFLLQLSCPCRQLQLCNPILSYPNRMGIKLPSKLNGCAYFKRSTDVQENGMENQNFCGGLHAAAAPPPTVARPCVFAILDFNQMQR
eukprot:1141679-Pelagomonas_calceolata.AAC.2